ncbi:MAG: hypothetical protein WD844_15045 [Thermoleophilaceae bacterium]
MRRTRISVAACVAALAVAGAAVPAEGHYRPVKSKCRTVVITPQTDNAVSAISVRKISCRTARRWLRSYATTGRGPLTRWRCRRRSHDRGLSHTDLRCTSRGRVIVAALS